MANKNSNFPSNQLNELPPEVCRATVDNLKELSQRGKPETETELRERIDQYFDFCALKDLDRGLKRLVLRWVVYQDKVCGCGATEGEEKAKNGLIYAMLLNSSL